MDLFEPAAAKAASEAAEDLRKRNADYWDVFVHSIRQSVVEAETSLRGSRFDPVRSTGRTSLTEGIGLRVVQHGLTGFAATTDYSLTGLRRALESGEMEPQNAGINAAAESRSLPLSADDPLSDLTLELLDASLSETETISEQSPARARASTNDLEEELRHGLSLLLRRALRTLRERHKRLNENL